ncbi:MAG: hypothetical protein M3Q07_22005, partial [Pseudobdellovibrionaceae bacterium]|nr:hypothetical protein [Pseudobdellovibrionaceae bacterium]
MYRSRTFKHILSTCVSTWILAGCHAAPETSAIKADETPTTLAQGRNGLTGFKAGDCLTFRTNTVNSYNPSALYRFAGSQAELAKILKVSTEELTGGVAGSPLAQLINKADLHPRLVYAVVGYKRVKQSQEPTEVALKQQVSTQYSSQDYAKFVASCGDEYVSKIETGDAIYGLIPIVVDSVEHRQSLAQAIGDFAGAPEQFFTLLEPYATLSVPALYIGQNVEPSQLTVEQFKTKFLDIAAVRTPVQMGRIGLETKRYAFPQASALQQQRFRYVDAFAALGITQLNASQCSQRLEVTQISPYEFASPGSLDLNATLESLNTYQTALNGAVESCLAGSCSAGVCAPTSCVAPEMPTEKAFVAACETSAPQILKTDSFIYRYAYNNPETVGQLLDVSKPVENGFSQKFSKRYAVRPEAAT